MKKIYYTISICLFLALGTQAQEFTPRIEYFQSPHTFGFAGQQQENSQTKSEHRLGEGFEKTKLNVKNIKEEEGLEDAIIVFPHPLGKDLIIKILDPDRGLVSLEIYAEGGALFMLSEEMDIFTEPTKIWDLDELPRGEYLLYIRGLEDEFENVYTISKNYD